MRDARNGNLSARANALTAHRAHVVRLAHGGEEDPSEEAEAGGMLEAEAQHDLRILRDAYLQVHKG